MHSCRTLRTLLVESGNGSTERGDRQGRMRSAFPGINPSGHLKGVEYGIPEADQSDQPDAKAPVV